MIAGIPANYRGPLLESGLFAGMPKQHASSLLFDCPKHFTMWSSGIAIGKISRFFADDIDKRHEGEASLSRLEGVHGALSPTIEVITVGGGACQDSSHPSPSDWLPPTELPDLRRAGILAIDVETRDDGIRADRGSAWPWRGGYVCGISVAWRADSGIRAHYFPIHHPDSNNFDPAQVFAWVKDLVASGVRFVTQNGLYDWGWLHSDAGILMAPSEQLEEIGALATLIDENRFNYSLDALCDWRGLPGKDTTLLQEAVKAAGWVSGKRSIEVAEHIYKLPARYVGPYAEADAVATLALFEDLNPILDKEGTRAAYRLEVDLLPMVHAMRRRGIRVDQRAAEQARDYCLQKRDAALAELSEELEQIPIDFTHSLHA
jgi:hypothetical protein